MSQKSTILQRIPDSYSCWTSLPCNSSNLETLVCVPDRGSSCNSRKASSAGQPQPSCNWPVSELLKRATRWTRVLVVSLPTPQPSSTTTASRFLFPVPVTIYRTSVIIAPQPPRGRQSDDELEMAPWPHHTHPFWQGKTTHTHTLTGEGVPGTCITIPSPLKSAGEDGLFLEQDIKGGSAFVAVFPLVLCVGNVITSLRWLRDFTN